MRDIIVLVNIANKRNHYFEKFCWNFFMFINFDIIISNNFTFDIVILDQK